MLAPYICVNAVSALCVLCFIATHKPNKISNVNTNYVYMIVWCAVAVAVACAAYIILSLVGCQIVVCVLGATRLFSDI